MKGIPDIYEKTCRDLTDKNEGFIEWTMDSSSGFVSGQFARAVAWFEKRHSWYLESAQYDALDEPESTWKARPYGQRNPPEPDSRVMKYFHIQKDERLLTTNSKNRPVILLRHAKSDWWNPPNAAYHEDYWLCIPMFTYKDRHNQNYVLNDQRLRNQDAFYIPPAHGDLPGVGLAEGVARFQAIQMIREDRLQPCKSMCNTATPKMQRPFRLSPIGLKLMLYHFYKAFQVFPDLESPQDDYTLFCDQINELIDNAAT